MAKLRSFGTKVRTPEQVREDLWAAGWEPMMAFTTPPHPDPKIQKLLLELNQANVMVEQRRLKKV